MRLAALRCGAALACAAWALAVQAADERFDLAEIAARPVEVGGFAEAKFEHLRLEPGAALYPLTFGGTAPRRTLDRSTLAIESNGRARHGIVTAYGRVSGVASTDALVSQSTGTALEAGVRASPAQGLSFDVGKQVQRWGKGYAWNPVAFFERPKDPNDPQLSREGFVIAGADWVQSRSGTVAALGVTPLVLPTRGGLNRDYGASGHANAGVRLYALVADTDIDLLWAAKGSRPQRLGLDFSRNIGSQLEVHGEWARATDATRTELASDGRVSTQRAQLDSWLLGLRYLSDNEVTWIAELYRNGGGSDAEQLARFHGLLDAAFGPGGTTLQQAQARALAQAGFGRPNPGRRYAYLRVSAKDAFDWLYLTPALTAIVNLDDHSAQLTPELLYTGWQNIELRLRAVWLHGRAGSEFGEKPASRRLEATLRLYF